MKQILWNIDAMGWFERVSHLIEYNKTFQWSGENVIKPNLDETIDAFANNGYEVTAVSSKSEEYVKECLKIMKLENRINYVAELWEKNILTDYSRAIGLDDDVIVIGARSGHEPMSIRTIFIHDFNSIKKNAMINYIIAQKLEKEGDGDVKAGFSKLFFGNFNNVEEYKDNIVVNNVDFDGLRLGLEIRIRGSYIIPTVMVEDNVEKKTYVWKQK